MGKMMKCEGCDEGPCFAKIQGGDYSGDCLLFFNADDIQGVEVNWLPADAEAEKGE